MRSAGIVVAVMLLSCGPPRPADRAQPAPPAPTIIPEVVWVQDDIPSARARAKAEGKLLFVDAWAPWCHTCLSMKHGVLDSPALRPYADRVVFAAIDTDRESNARFLETHEVRVWPSLFVIDPKTDQVLGFWPGAASLGEVRGLLDDALAIQDEHRDPSDPRFALVEARRALARGQHQAAFDRYVRLIANVPAAWPRRSEALTGAMWSVYRMKDWQACASFGMEHVDEVRGAAAPADFCFILMQCGLMLAADGIETQAVHRAEQRLRQLVTHPPVESSIDDRADAMLMLAAVLKARDDDEGFRALHERRLRIMEEDASRAASPREASTHDYARAVSYMALGRSEEAIRMLEQRERELPDAYEPAARLADVLLEAGRYEQALAAIDRAIAKAYGPRLLRYLDTRATILEKLGRRDEMLETLRKAAEGHKALARGLADEKRLEQARKRYEEAVKSEGE